MQKTVQIKPMIPNFELLNRKVNLFQVIQTHLQQHIIDQRLSEMLWLDGLMIWENMWAIWNGMLGTLMTPRPHHRPEAGFLHEGSRRRA